MKKLIMIAALASVTLASNAQSPFDKYEDLKGVSSIVMNQKMFKLLSKVDLNSSDPEMQQYINLVDNLENVKMYTSANAGIMDQMNTSMKGYIASSGLQELMRAKDDGKNVKFYYKEGSSEDYVKEFVMFLNGNMEGEQRAVFFQVTGNIDLKQISKLAQDLDFKGSEALKEVQNAKKS
ncbi:DUF4252 domain-containing protein [Dokdonia donghaensis]|uniref:DNA topoisomerase IV subunit B n=1 Tax=Dokdonia donghaensis DSW-1 TaxID=1300343 RepID=A0A0A2GZ91_9FLAO|nr:DUF4252 domain-containing protein [Dokdonia donghaensis]ANH60593.1 hypothetical protein I597_1689 [Dokdonia donghaensis DSW-1]KGO07838.1 DNA topoisomerase IV subunit B [Dokdonia donghaensis DSW-1]